MRWTLARREPIPARPAIQSDKRAGLEAQRYKDLRARIEQIDAEEKAKIAAIRQRYEDRRRPLVVRADEKLSRVQAWGEATRSGRKTIELPNGRKLEWRLPSSPQLMVVGKIETIVRLLLRLPNWRKYLEVNLKKNNIKADLDELKEISGLRRGLRLNNTEYFRIT